MEHCGGPSIWHRNWKTNSLYYVWTDAINGTEVCPRDPSTWFRRKGDKDRIEDENVFEKSIDDENLKTVVDFRSIFRKKRMKHTALKTTPVVIVQ